MARAGPWVRGLWSGGRVFGGKASRRGCQGALRVGGCALRWPRLRRMHVGAGGDAARAGVGTAAASGRGRARPPRLAARHPTTDRAQARSAVAKGPVRAAIPHTFMQRLTAPSAISASVPAIGSAGTVPTLMPTLTPVRTPTPIVLAPTPRELPAPSGLVSRALFAATLCVVTHATASCTFSAAPPLLRPPPRPAVAPIVTRRSRSRTGPGTNPGPTRRICRTSGAQGVGRVGRGPSGRATGRLERPHRSSACARRPQSCQT